MGVASAVAAGVGIAGQLIEGSSAQSSGGDSARYNAEANILKNKQSKIQAQRQREMDAAKVRSAKSSMLTTAAGSGTLNSSGYEGSSGALTSEFTANLGYGSQMQKIQDQIVQYENLAIESNNDASEASQAGGFFGQVASIASAFI